MTHPTNPYPGPRSFQPGEKLYGRQRETWELLDLLIAKRIVLLYSPSGAGKTSLIQAALIPELKKEGYRVLPIMRPGLEPEAAVHARNRYILSLLLSLEEDVPKEQQKTPLDELAQMTLPEYLERHYGRGKEDEDDVNANVGRDDWYGDVLIFDQFEEVLTVDPTDREAKADFFRQVGQVLRDPHRWALFSMREEFVAGLDPYLRSLPTRFTTTYRLELLGVDAARDAMQKPARTVNRDFTDAAANQLVDDLRAVKVQQPDGSTQITSGLYVEPVQLQVVCWRLWEKPGVLDDKIIDVNDLEGVGDVDQALRGYYADSVAAISKETGAHERTIRDWVGRKLITENGIRGQVLMESERSNGLANEAIKGLEDAHLVRVEPRRGATWFELAHDRLVRPVRKDNAAWFDAHLSTLQRQAVRWHRQHHNPGLLLRGDALKEVERWAEVYKDDLEDHEEAFLEACRDANERIKWGRAYRKSIAVVIIVMILAILAGWGWLRSSQETARANQETARANSLRLANQARDYLDQRNITGALLFGVEADKTLEIEENKTVRPFLHDLSSFLLNVESDVTPSHQTQATLLAVLDAFYTPHGNEEDKASPALAWRSGYELLDGDQLVDGTAFDATLVTVRDKQIILWWEDENGVMISETLPISSSVAISVAAFSPTESQLVTDGIEPPTSGTGVAGQLLATIDEKGGFALWVVGPNKEITRYDGRELPPTEKNEVATALAFNPDGKKLAVAICIPDEEQSNQPGGSSSCRNAFVRIWDVAQADPLLSNPKDMSVPRFKILDLAFGGNIPILAWIDEKNRLFVGNPATRLRDRKRLISSSESKNETLKQQDRIITFISDSDWLVSGGCLWDETKGKCQDGFVRLWNVRDRTPFGPVLKVTAKEIRDLGYITGIADLVTLDNTNQTVLWAIGPSRLADWRTLACRKAERNMTYQEWNAAFSDKDYRDTCADNGYGRHPSFAWKAMEEGNDKIRQCADGATKEAKEKYAAALELEKDSNDASLPFDNVNDWAIHQLVDQTWQLLAEEDLDKERTELCFQQVDQLLAEREPEEKINAAAAQKILGELANIMETVQGDDPASAWKILEQINLESDNVQQPDVVIEAFEHALASAYQVFCFSDQLEEEDKKIACEKLITLSGGNRPISMGKPVASSAATQSLWVFEGERGEPVTIALDTVDSRFDPSLRLRGEDGRELASDEDGGGGNALIQDFLIPKSGEYFIQVEPGDSPALYTMSLRKSAFKSIFMGKPVTSTTNIQSLWVFEGEAGDIVTIAMDAADAEFDPYITLKSGDGRKLISDDDSGGGLNALIQDFPLPESGDYFVQTGPSGSDALYTIWLRSSAPVSITIGEPVTNTTAIQSLWVFEGEAGDIVTIAMDATDAEFDPYITLKSGDGRELISDDDSGGGLNALIQDFILTGSGEYLISATGLSGSGSYTLSLNKGKQLKTITMNKSVESTTQEDMLWTFTGAAGDIVTISLTGANESFDPYLTLMDRIGHVLGENDDSGEGWNGYDARIQNFVLPTTGDYLVRVGRPGSAEPYTLSITKEVPLTVSPPARIDLSEGVVWVFDGQEGQLMHIAVESEDEESALFQLTLLGADGGPFAKEIYGILAPLSETAAYTMVVTGGASDPGIHFLTLEEITATVNSLTYTHPSSGQLDAGVIDYWSFTGDTSQAAAINVAEGSEPVFMELYGPDGGLLRTYDGGDPTSGTALISGLPLTGTYYVTVRGITPEMTGAYALALERTDVAPIPQACDADTPDNQVDYGPISVGSRVILGRHRPVDGSANWAESMAQYVDREAVVTSLNGSDNTGCPMVSVDIDNGEWFWRIRDMIFIQ